MLLLSMTLSITCVNGNPYLDYNMNGDDIDTPPSLRFNDLSNLFPD